MRVLILASARRDLDALFTYIKDDLHNEVAARNTVAKILRRVQPLASFPEMGPSLVGVNQALAGYRYLVADNYLIIYKIISTEIHIVHIPYVRSDYVQLLQG
ncbi:MAG: type II toxin-antitoxin system RelE/ParE family toxin [Acidobacteriota bacterium]